MWEDCRRGGNGDKSGGDGGDMGQTGEEEVNSGDPSFLGRDCWGGGGVGGGAGSGGD